MRIDSRESMEKAVEKYGILPFFPNNIRGLSIEELCLPGMLFGGNYDEGCWEWKGPVIRKRTSGYGKFFKRKAGFVSLDLLPYFLAYRRNTYTIAEGSTEEIILDIIKENDSLSSTELKKLIFGTKHNTRNCWDLPDEDRNEIPFKNKGLESPLQKLQMAGRVIISDFEYKKTKRGERYGWGVARYSTPEIVFGPEISLKNLSNQEALGVIVERVKKNFPFTNKNSILTLIK